jgi:hypothetical protein
VDDDELDRLLRVELDEADRVEEDFPEFFHARRVEIAKVARATRSKRGG